MKEEKEKERILNRVKGHRCQKPLGLGRAMEKPRTRTLWFVTLAKGESPEGENTVSVEDTKLSTNKQHTLSFLRKGRRGGIKGVRGQKGHPPS